ncbi:MAG: GtrA family protein [Polyangiaceae bacterium]
MGELPHALIPIFVVALYLVGAVASFAVAYGLRGWRDAEMDQRGSSLLLPMPIRQLFTWATLPIWHVLRGARLPATAVTSLAMLLSIGASLSAAVGHFALGGWLYLSAGLCDFFDGRLARDQGAASPRGAAIDSVLDRYSDAAVLAGLGWYYRDQWVLAVVLTALVGSLLVSYIRARGEGLGASVKVGLMQRPERVVLLGAALALSSVVAWATGRAGLQDQIVIGALVVLAATTQITALRRFVHLLRALTPNPESSCERSQVLRAGISSLLATGADFGLVLGLVTIGLPPWLATGIGCLLGAAINFGINRVWTFRRRDEAAAPQALRYTVVSTTSAILNAGGVGLLLLLSLPDYRAAWLVARVLVFLCWNYPLQRDYVYAASPPKTAEGPVMVRATPSAPASAPDR